MADMRQEIQASFESFVATLSPEVRAMMGDRLLCSMVYARGVSEGLRIAKRELGITDGEPSQRPPPRAALRDAAGAGRERAHAVGGCARGVTGMKRATSKPYPYIPATDAGIAALHSAAWDLLRLAREYRKAVEYYIRIDEKNGDREDAFGKRITLRLIEDVIAKAEGRS